MQRTDTGKPLEGKYRLSIVFCGFAGRVCIKGKASTDAIGFCIDHLPRHLSHRLRIASLQKKEDRPG